MASVLHRVPKNSLFAVQIQFLRHTPVCLFSSEVVETGEKKFPKIKDAVHSIRRGTGGRSSFNGKVATVFGATGFLGRAVINQLGKIGTQIIIPYRTDPYNCLRLKLCGDLGQIYFTHFNLKDEDAIYKAIKHSNIVINMIGRDYETPNFSMNDINVKAPQTIARLSRELGVQTFLQVSTLNACEKPQPVVSKKGSKFYSTKWEGEEVVRQEFPDAIIFRPSDIYGHQDSFIHYYMSQTRRTWRMMSLWNRGRGIIKQPVYRSDVAKGIVRAVMDPDAAGHTFQAVGPHRYELSELMDWFHRVMMRTAENWYYRLDIRMDLSFWMRLYFSEIFLPRYRQLSWERLERESTTDVILPNLPTLEDLGVELTQLEDRVFYELKPFRMHAYHDPLLATYIRPVEPCPLAKA